MRYRLCALGAVLTLALSGCGGSTADPIDPDAAGPPAPSTTTSPSTNLTDTTVAYLKAWAANDVATMVRNSAPGTPARGYADYWGDVYAAGRLDSGAAQLRVRRESATLTYSDGTTYRLSGFEADTTGLVTWAARPGGALAPRIVTGPPVSTRVAGLRITARIQYLNSESGLRISLRVGNAGDARRDFQTPVYTSPDGHRSTAAAGSGGRTGIVRVGPGSDLTALVAAADAAPGGRLQIRVYNAVGSPLGSAVLTLPR